MTKTTKNTWTRERELEALWLREHGASYIEIGKVFGRNASTIQQKFQQTGFHHLTDEEYEHYGALKSTTRRNLYYNVPL